MIDTIGAKSDLPGSRNQKAQYKLRTKPKKKLFDSIFEEVSDKIEMKREKSSRLSKKEESSKSL